jgi:hypothetical protein
MPGSEKAEREVEDVIHKDADYSPSKVRRQVKADVYFESRMALISFPSLCLVIGYPIFPPNFLHG